MDPQTPISPFTQSKLKLAMAGGAILVAIALAIGGYFLITSSTMAFKGLRYLAGTFEDRALYEFGWQGVKQVSLPVEGKLIDYARSGSAQAAIIGITEGEQNVYLIEGRESRPLVTSPGIRTSIAIAPAGTHVAYAERTTDPVEDPRAFFAPASWKIRVLNVEANESTAMGNGIAPHFFNRNGVLHIAYMSTEGLHIANLETGTHQNLAIGLKDPNGAFPVIVSDDGTQIAVPTPAGIYTLLTLKSAEGGGFTLGTSGNLTADARTIAFKGKSIYSTARSSEESFFYRSGMSMPEKPTAFERIPFMLVTKLIP